MKKLAIDLDHRFDETDLDRPAFGGLDSTVTDIAFARASAMEEASTSVLMYGWSPADCRIEHDTITKRDLLYVGTTPVFEVTETWTDTKCTVTWRWLCEVPEREGFEVPKA